MYDVVVNEKTSRSGISSSDEFLVHFSCMHSFIYFDSFILLLVDVVSKSVSK